MHTVEFYSFYPDKQNKAKIKLNFAYKKNWREEKRNTKKNRI